MALGPHDRFSGDRCSTGRKSGDSGCERRGRGDGRQPSCLMEVSSGWLLMAVSGGASQEWPLL